MEFTKPEKLSIKNHPELTERWIQDYITKDPGILGLGDVIVKDYERRQQRAGRLDLVLQHIEESHRYEVEIQLGTIDESHIIRTIEYWDIERKRYPQYEHTAVIIAEDITSRFLNILSLFNGMIPLIAIQMNAIKLGDKTGLLFTTVLSPMTLGLVDEDEIMPDTDRSYWENRATPASMEVADKLLKIAKGLDGAFEYKYNKFYIGLTRNGLVDNFFVVRPQKNATHLDPRLEQNEEIDKKLESAGLDVLDYNIKDGRYRIRLNPKEFKQQEQIITEIITKAFLISADDTSQ